MVSRILGIKTPKQDPAVAQAQKDQADSLKRQEETNAADKKSLQQRSNAALNAVRGRRAGSRSLLSGLETGVTGLRTSLG